MLFTHNSEKEFPEIRKEVSLEIELNGKIRFDNILDEIYHKMGILYKITAADVEFFGEQNFGTLKLMMMLNCQQKEHLEHFLAEKKLLNTFFENAQKKAV